MKKKTILIAITGLAAGMIGILIYNKKKKAVADAQTSDAAPVPPSLATPPLVKQAPITTQVTMNAEGPWNQPKSWTVAGYGW